jgi:hypothetical protein
VTEIQIQGRQFLIDGAPTYRGVTHRGEPVEGLLLNSRMVNAIFDDENPGTTGGSTGWPAGARIATRT